MHEGISLVSRITSKGIGLDSGIKDSFGVVDILVSIKCSILGRYSVAGYSVAGCWIAGRTL